MHPPLPRAAIVLTLTLMLAAGCSPQPAAPKPAPKPSEAARSVGKGVTESESRAVAEAIEKAVGAGDERTFDAQVDWAALDQASIEGIDAPESARKGFTRGLEESRKNHQGLSKSIIDSVARGGTYSLLHDHVQDGRRRLLFRLQLAEGGLNYHDLILARREDGKVRVVDLMVFMSGELFSQTIRRLFLQAAAQRSTGLLARLSGADRKQVEFFDKIVSLNQARKDEQPARVLAIYKTCPPELQKDKAILLMRLQAAQKLGDDPEYARSIDDFRNAYPGDPAIDLLSVDGEILKKHYPEALACVDRLDKAVLGDPFLDTFRAAIHMEQGDFDAARADVERAKKAAPELLTAYWTGVSVELKAKDNARTLQALREIRDRFQMQFADLSQEEAYREFSQSPEGKQWTSETPAAPPGPTPGEPKP